MTRKTALRSAAAPDPVKVLVERAAITTVMPQAVEAVMALSSEIRTAQAIVNTALVRLHQSAPTAADPSTRKFRLISTRPRPSSSSRIEAKAMYRMTESRSVSFSFAT